MEERVRELEARLARAEESLRLLATHLAVTPDEGLKVSAPLRVTDSNGRTMLEVDLDDSGPRLCLVNADGRPGLMLHQIETGGSLSVHNGAGRPVALLFADVTGGDLALYDHEGNELATEP